MAQRPDSFGKRTRFVAASLTFALTTTACASAQTDEEHEWLEFERKIEERLALEPEVLSLEGEAITFELAFHGDLVLEGEPDRPWSEALREPYVRAASRWLEVVRGVQGRDSFELTFHLIALPFDFGNGFATPQYESLEKVGLNWLPTEALIGINTMLYSEEVQGEDWVEKEIYDNALHEIGHALGIGSLWNLARWGDQVEAFAPQDLREDAPDEILRQMVTEELEYDGLVYRGPSAVKAFREVHGVDLDFVPISSDGGHLFALFDEERERYMPDGSPIPSTDRELMSHRDVLSAISVGFLEDVGWRVDAGAASALPVERTARPEPRSGSLRITTTENDPLAPFFPKRVEVHGLGVLATAGASDEKLLHAAAILAEYLDNDEDGQPDDRRVHEELLSHNATLVFFRSQREAERIFDQLPWDELEPRVLQDLYADETHPDGHESGDFDASLEEVLHLVTHGGYAPAYPDTFGEQRGSVLANLMDNARGGHHRRVPRRYPEGAWYTYDDRTCEYDCQVTEYIYWGLTSLLGAQSFPGRRAEIQHEWRLETPEKLAAGDPGLFELLTDPRWNLPTRLPDGVYAPRSED